MDGNDGWSEIAAEWSELWGDFAAPVHGAIIREAGIGKGTTVLDVGCGSGEFLRTLEQWGADPTGIDPAPGMVALAGPRARIGDFDQLPWPNDTFDVVTAINALQFADDTLDALAEAKRVTVPGGAIAIANWAEGALNDLDVIERAIADHESEDHRPDDDLRRAGGLERLFADAGVELVASGVVHLPWRAPDIDTLVRGVLLGEDAGVRAALTPVIVEAAAPYKSEGYELMNAFRFVVGIAA